MNKSTYWKGPILFSEEEGGSFRTPLCIESDCLPKDSRSDPTAVG